MRHEEADRVLVDKAEGKNANLIHKQKNDIKMEFTI
jgi:hypothetical protein